jgi:hypothetical protein
VVLEKGEKLRSVAVAAVRMVSVRSESSYGLASFGDLEQDCDCVAYVRMGGRSESSYGPANSADLEQECVACVRMGGHLESWYGPANSVDLQRQCCTVVTASKGSEKRLLD